MIITIKSEQTLETLGVFPLLAFTYASGASGSATFLLEEDAAIASIGFFTSQYAIVDGDVFGVQKCVYSKGVMTLTLCDPVKILKGRCFLFGATESSQMSIAGIVRLAINQLYASVGRYNITVSTAASRIQYYFRDVERVASERTYTDREQLLNDLASLGLYFRFSLESDRVMGIHVEMIGEHEKNIVLGADNILQSESYDVDIVSKVFVQFKYKLSSTDTEIVNGVMQLTTDGDIKGYADHIGSETYTPVGGGLTMLTCTKQTITTLDQLRAIAKTEFFDFNEYSSNVEILSTEKYLPGEILNFKLHGQVFHGAVTSITKSMADGFYRVKVGSLQTLLSEKTTKKAIGSTIYL